MIFDLDIWRAANLLIRQHGDDAELAAARRADLMHAALWTAVWTFGPSLNAVTSKGKPSGSGSDGLSSSCKPRRPARLIDRWDDLVMAIPNLSSSSMLRLNNPRMTQRSATRFAHS
jgi:hypothetical protein